MLDDLFITVGNRCVCMATRGNRKNRRANIYRHMVKSMRSLGDFTANSLCDHMSSSYTYTPSVQSLSMHLRWFVREGQVRIIHDGRARREYRWVADVQQDP